MSESKPKISVIVPVFNVKKHLQKCFLSIANQTYENLEVLVVDDGSFDGSEKVCDQWAEKDKRFVVIHKTNGGLSSARNVGLEKAKGEFVLFVDSDDFVEPNMIEKLVKAQTKAKAEICACLFSMETEAGETYADVPKFETKSCTGIESLKFLNQPRQDRYVVAWNKLYKKELFDDIKFPLGKIHEDQWTIHELFFKAKKVAFVSDELYHYVIHEGSLSRNKNPIKHLDDIDALFSRVEFLKNKGFEELSFDVENAMFDLFGFYREQFFAYQNFTFKELSKIVASGKACFKFFKANKNKKRKQELKKRKQIYTFSIKQKLKLMWGNKIKSRLKKWKKI